MAVHFAAGCAEHPARGDGPDARAGGARLRVRCAERPWHACRAERAGCVLHRQDHHHPLLVSRGVLPERAAVRLSVFPLHARAPSCAGRERVAGAAGRPRRRRRDSAARHRERRRQAHLAGRRVVAVAGRSRAVDPQHSRAGRDRRHRGRGPRFRGARQADRAHRDDAVGVRAGSAARGGPDARPPARHDRQPAAVAGKRRNAAADHGCRRGPAAASERDHRLRAARNPGEGQVRHRDRRRRVDRFGDLRARRRRSARRGCW